MTGRLLRDPENGRLMRDAESGLLLREAPAAEWGLTVRSEPENGVDIGGDGGGTTEYTRRFPDDVHILLVAPVWWWFDGVQHYFAGWRFPAFEYEAYNLILFRTPDKRYWWSQYPEHPNYPPEEIVEWRGLDAVTLTAVYEAAD